MKIRNDIKTKIKKHQRKIVDLARALKVNYEVLNRKLNGRANIDDKLEARINRVFASWEKNGV